MGTTTMLCVVLLLTVTVVNAVEMSLEPKCNRGKSLGNCPGQDPRWMYDVMTGNCRAIPGGCPSSSNFNNFDSQTECEDACLSSSKRVARQAPQAPQGYIKIGRREGEGEGRQVRTRTGRKRGGRRRTSEPVPSICTLGPERGMCRAALRQWYYNESAGRCETFNWGGCGGNENRFPTEEACLQRCG